MKVLSLTQPWASLVALGEKRIETRSWATNYTGLLAIHAAKRYPGWAKSLEATEPFRSSLRVPHGQYAYPELNCGNVLCIVKLMGCRLTIDVVNQISDTERAFGDYSPGRYAWFLEFVERLENPLPAKGHLGLWEWDREAAYAAWSAH
jgi:activating signal cointegrator 1